MPISDDNDCLLRDNHGPRNFFSTIDIFTGIDQNADWTLKHGRSAALSVALKESASTIYVGKDQEKVCKVILSYLFADRTQIAMNGVRACGYLFQYLMNEEQTLPQQILTPFVKVGISLNDFLGTLLSYKNGKYMVIFWKFKITLCISFQSMNNNSNDVKQLLARVCTHLARNVPAEKMSPELLKALLPMLVNGTKEKNGYVKANSELALIAVLRLRQGDEEQQVKIVIENSNSNYYKLLLLLIFNLFKFLLQRCMALLEVGARESLSDVVSKVLRKVISQPEGKIEELDDTLLT